MFFLTKTVEIRWNWQCKIFSLKFQRCKFFWQIPCLPPNRQCPNTEGTFKKGVCLYVIMVKLYLTWCNSISECQLSLTRGSCGGLSPGSSQSWPSPEIHLHTLPPANTLPPAKIIIIIIINIIKNLLDCMFVQIATWNQVFLIPFYQRHFQFGWRKFQVSLLMPNLIFGKCTSTFCPFKTILTFLESS